MQDDQNPGARAEAAQPAAGGKQPRRSRLQWYDCPHRERFLARGILVCPLCEPLAQGQLDQPAPAGQSGVSPALRTIFPILAADGTPLPRSHPVPPPPEPSGGAEDP